MDGKNKADIGEEGTATDSRSEGNATDQTDYKSKYLYLLAEIENYKKTKDRELLGYISYSNEKLMLDMLKILDDFESVLKNEKNGAIEALFRSLTSLLSSYGLERMNVVGENYSPDLAEVVYTEKSELAQGKITEEVQAGYRLNGKIIRYPKVKIAV